MLMCVYYHAGAAAAQPPAKQVPPPEDEALRKTIDAMAPFVARNGAAFEALAARQNARDNRFAFLQGGPGAEYYRWRVQASSAHRFFSCKIPRFPSTAFLRTPPLLAPLHALSGAGAGGLSTSEPLL